MHALILLISLCLLPFDQPRDKDTDSDGLSDFQEMHKYLTDPRKADSDGDGTPDGDWNERREYTYTVRAVLHAMPPYNLEAMNDDYQDARALDERDDYLEVEVIHYPFNTCADSIGENKNWRKDYASMKAYLRPGVTTNWDRKMQKDLLAALGADGIDVKKLTDREAVEKVSEWLMKHAEYEDSFTTFAAVFPRGKARVSPELEDSVERELEKHDRTLKEQWDRELFGKGMYYNKIRGSCTSSAIYIATGLKAVGIPTRTIVCFPVIDASDEGEKALIRQLENHVVRSTIEESVAQRGNSWASHTFNEVYVDNRWRRLNYSRLGQNILDRQCLGLMTHVHTFDDHAKAGLVTWGIRNARADKNDIFGHSNPYSYISLSDRFGEHCKLENPPAEAGFQELTITRMYWYHDKGKPEVVQMRLDDENTAGHLVVHVREGRPDDGPGQYKPFYEKVDKEFRLRARGKPDIRAHATRGYWTNVKKNVMDFYLRIDPAEFKRMAYNVPYELVAVEEEKQPRWKVSKGVSITRKLD